MIPVETLKEYQAFLEYRVLSALEKRCIEYESDVTRALTAAVTDLGNQLRYHVTLERKYHPGQAESARHRSDVHWRGEVGHIWEIDRTLKDRSAHKLAGASEPEKIWVLWAKDAELISLRLLDLHGINVMVLSQDVRKVIWGRLMLEAFQRREVQYLLNQKNRYLEAEKREAGMRGRPDA